MSPFTPTLPETQTPLITPGSFATKPLIAEVATQMHRILPDDKQKEITDGISQREQQKAHLTTLLEDLKLSQKDYDFSNYHARLLLSDVEIENILETEIFRKDGELTELGKSFYEYLGVLTEGKSEEIKGKMKRKLIGELWLEIKDRVYESDTWVLIWSGWTKRIDFKNKEQFFQDIKKSWLSGTKSLNLWSNNLFEKLEVSDLIELVKQVGLSGIKSLILSNNFLSETLEVSDFLELVKQAGLSGIRCLDLWKNQLSDKLEASDFLELVKQAGLSGIKSLSLSWNILFEILEASDFIALIKESGESGIGRLDLSRNWLSRKFDSQDFLELVKQTRFSGVRYLDFSGNELSEKLDISQKQEIDNIAKQYNMKIDYIY